MIVATVIYIPVANFSDKLERKPFVVITFVFFTLFPVILSFSRSWMMLVIAFVVRGLKEFGEPTLKAMIMDFALEKAQVRTVGVYYFIRDFVVSFAALLGARLWKISPNVNLITAALFGAAGTLFFICFWKRNRWDDFSCT
jgi:MFS family permease